MIGTGSNTVDGGGQAGGLGGHSANVIMRLRIDGVELPVAQVGGGRIVLARGAVVPGSLPMEGELSIDVDGVVQRSRVRVASADAEGRVLAAVFGAVFGAVVGE